MASHPLIAPTDLAIADPAPIVIDVRPAEQFAAGHLPGAYHFDLWGLSLIDTSEAPLRAFMWMIGHLYSLRGVTPDRPVVIYENDSGMRAARGARTGRFMLQISARDAVLTTRVMAKSTSPISISACR